MHYIAYVSLRGLYASEASSRLTWPSDKPLLIVREKSVIDLNSAAERAGCSNGMSKAEASAVLADSSCISYFSREHVSAIREKWLNLCTAFSGIIEPEDCHSAFVDLSLHSDPLSVAKELTKTLQSEMKLEVDVRVSFAKWMSKIAPASIESIAETNDWLPNLGVEKLPINRKYVLRLKLLGYRTIGDVARLPRSLIKSQFCEDAWLIHELANGRYKDLPKPLFPQCSAWGRVEIEGGASDWPSIQRAIARVAALIAKSLSRLDSITRSIELEVTFDSGKTTSLIRNFAKPIHSRIGLMRAIAIMLPEINEPITLLKASCRKLERRTRAQITLEETVAERTVSANAAIQALKSAFGDSSILAADEIDQPREVEVMRAWKAATGWF